MKPMLSGKKIKSMLLFLPFIIVGLVFLFSPNTVSRASAVCEGRYQCVTYYYTPLDFVCALRMSYDVYCSDADVSHGCEARSLFTLDWHNVACKLIPLSPGPCNCTSPAAAPGSYALDGSGTMCQVCFRSPTDQTYCQWNIQENDQDIPLWKCTTSTPTPTSRPPTPTSTPTPPGGSPRCTDEEPGAYCANVCPDPGLELALPWQGATWADCGAGRVCCSASGPTNTPGPTIPPLPTPTPQPGCEGTYTNCSEVQCGGPGYVCSDPNRYRRICISTRQGCVGQTETCGGPCGGGQPTATPVPVTNRPTTPSSCATASVFQLITFSASPAPSVSPQGHVVRVLSQPAANADPTIANFGPENCNGNNTLPTAAKYLYCGTTLNSVRWQFASAGEKKIWAVFHNDVNGTGGWSAPVSIPIIYKPYDIVEDGAINQTDFNKLTTDCYSPLGGVAAGCGRTDLNCDNVVNAWDYSLFIKGWEGR